MIQSFTPVSTNIASVSHDSDTDTLTIEFANGATYDYMNCPASVYRAFQGAASAGQFFIRQIKSRYSYEQV